MSAFRHSSDRMSSAVEIRAWLQETMKRNGLTVEQWAAKAGVARSTIFRALKPGYQFVTSSRTLAKLAAAVDAEPPSALTHVRLEPQFLSVRYRVQAGLWFEVDAEEPPEQIAVAVLPDPRYAPFPQWLEKIIGDSVDLKIPPGHYAHVVDAIEMGYAPKDGDWVIVERRRDQGAVRERTIKQVLVTETGKVLLCPRSRNPKWSEPVDLAKGGRPGDIEVEIVGLVVGAYDPNF